MYVDVYLRLNGKFTFVSGMNKKFPAIRTKTGETHTVSSTTN